MYKTTTLVLMNMTAAHSRYLSTNAKSVLFHNVLVQIKRAISDRLSVIIRDFPDFSVSEELNCTHAFITDVLQRYPYQASICTDSNDGPDEIIKTCRRLDFPTKHIQICGLYTNYCIRDKAVELAQELPESLIEVMRNACASTNPDDELRECFWNRFSQPNIVITPPPTILPWSANQDDQQLYFSARARDHMRRLYGETVSI